MRAYNRLHPDACVTHFTSPEALQTGSAAAILEEFSRQVHPDDLAEMSAYIQAHLASSAHTLATGEIQKYTSRRFRGLGLHGEYCWYEIRSRLFLHGSGLVVVEGLFTEVTELMELLLTDPLTGLPNRAATERWLQTEINQDAQQQLVILNLELDNFRAVNNFLGRARGDQVIREVADILRDLTAHAPWLARPGANEFLVALTPAAVAEPTTIHRVNADLAQRMARQLQERVHLSLSTRTGLASRISVSCGVAVQKPTVQDATALMQQADTALSNARQQGSGSICVYSEELTTHLEKRLRLEHDLEQALQQGELCLAYQPQVNRQGAWIGAEVLVRWPQSDGSTIPPDDFIAIAEQTGQIHRLGQWVLEQACTQLSCWQRQGLATPSLAINLSTVQLESRPFGAPSLIATLQHLCTVHGIRSDQISFEITETALLTHWDRAMEQLEPLITAGVKLAIDDFGTGYSSLKLLQALPIYMIKLDKFFVQQLPGSEENRRLIRGMLQIARELELETMAEGVETPAQWQELQALGCNSYQGFLFSRPLPAEEFGRLWRHTVSNGHDGLEMAHEHGAASPE